MLSRLVRIQLVIFTIASIVGVLVMVFTYMQVPTLLGVGRLTVKLELPASGGLYRFANVTYRGVQIGKVTAMDVSRTHATATLSLDTSPKIPADLVVEVRSVSAVGEQYVELLPRTDSPPYLQDGSVIAMADTRIPQQVSPMLDQVSALLNSIPKDSLSGLIDESFTAFGETGYELGSLVDSSSRISSDLNSVAQRSATLVEDTRPLLVSQAQTTDALELWARSLAGITGQVVTNDPQIRTLLQRGPEAAKEVSQLLNQVKPTLPVLLANLTTFGQVAVTYRPSLEQVLVLLPPFVANTLASSPENNPTGIPLGDFRIQIADPNPCTVGFLPPSSWRSPADTTTLDTPDGIYCKLPQDSPIVVRGARNAPCMGVPGKRAPTVEICYSDEPYRPLAMREHSLGPAPIDPNLIAQGVPPDDRVSFQENIHAPIEGTPPPQGPPPAAAVPATPNSLDAKDSTPGPSVAIAHYDPQTGQFATPDGTVGHQTDLVDPPKNWQDLVFKGQR
ncbi:MCE family protein [Mycolicibacterium holsaticum]|uniref:MCE family protein n=1 Tax=Mycolicibacterium holsaticum TaxID=152142 RepID=UPI001C7D8980|nr:MlaD family protein [Mycolicibacterium holsaticum]QZA10931.1 MCE family protein [Mycolicibacterium holsaticum DSM 44478 = JCM 12374]UNC11571.1 MCE family protein [Mycolicibacterium holsaticum DSM 44478 = JCM 12374]